MTRRTWLMMGGAAAVWGASYMFIKLALDDFSEGAIVCIRTALGAAVLLTLAARWGALSALRGRWLTVALVGCAQVIAPFLLITFGENHIDSQLPGAPPVAVAGGEMAVAALVTLPLALASLPDHAPSFKAAGGLVVLGAAGTGIAFLWFYTLIAEVGPARASVIAYIAPGFSVVYGVVLLD